MRKSSSSKQAQPILTCWEQNPPAPFPKRVFAPSFLWTLQAHSDDDPSLPAPSCCYRPRTHLVSTHNTIAAPPEVQHYLSERWWSQLSSPYCSSSQPSPTYPVACSVLSPVARPVLAPVARTACVLGCIFFCRVHGTEGSAAKATRSHHHHPTFTKDAR